jgi:signal transduction histidine kinase
MDGTELIVRFNVPRERLSDDTAHALLRMIRELVQNAIRHGRANTVKIAGSLEAEQLLFSVQDNGCGFDPDDHPGIMQGHFGLQGIRERVMRFGGKIEIASAPGKGTKVTISIQTTHRQ